jgi:histidinol-phosphate aminotransferase
VKRAVDANPNIRLIFLCSPGNPTGTVIILQSIRALLDYRHLGERLRKHMRDADFEQKFRLSRYSVCFFLQVLAGSSLIVGGFVSLGIALAQPPLIKILSNTKAPYNISTPTAHLALSALSPLSLASMKKNLGAIKSEREKLPSAFCSPALTDLGVGSVIGGNDANFLVVPILERGSSRDAVRKPSSERAQRVYKTLAENEGVVVRYRGNELGCDGCLRITVGTKEENAVMLKKLEALLRVL